MENGTHSDSIVATVRKSIALEVLAGYLFLSAITIAFALASGPAQLLLGILWLIIFVAFANSKSHHNESYITVSMWAMTAKARMPKAALENHDVARATCFRSRRQCHALLCTFKEINNAAGLD